MPASTNTQSERPEGPISVIRQLKSECSGDCAAHAIDQHKQEITLLKNETDYFVCVSEDSCSAENNGRPVSSHTERYYVMTAADPASVTADNWKENVIRPAAYHISHSWVGVL